MLPNKKEQICNLLKSIETGDSESIFRFEDGQAVEHWDNIQKRQEPNISGYTMVDGETEVTDHEMTESNRMVIQSFVEDVLVNGCIEKCGDYINHEQYMEHSPRFGNDLVELSAALSKSNADGSISIRYEKSHRLLAEGNFVLSVCEGHANQVPSSFFDLYRLRDGKIIEHWDTTEAIPSRDKWKNNNGKF